MKRIFFSAVAFLFLASVSAQSNLQDTMGTGDSRSANYGFAEEEFRRGVQSYYRGAFNESILEFEKALSYLPGEPLVLDWLGKAYYKAGIEGAALQQWNYEKDSGHGGLLLQNRIEIVSDRRVTDSAYGFTQRFTEAGSYPNFNGKNIIFSQPVSSLSNNDGTIWVVSYGTNELLQFDVNGTVIRRNRGPINGFDRPMDVIRLKNGNLAVSESAGDRISILSGSGSFIKYFGSRGCGQGQFVGPQYLAEDEFGNIYVTDFGNARVVVLDADGNGLLHFGEKRDQFDGLKSPTGIAVCAGRIFVADSVKGGIYEFDKSGNYIGVLVNNGTFSRPESLKPWGNDYLLLTDRNKVYSVDLASGAVHENAVTGKGRSLITSAVSDRNGNIIVTDFKENEIYVMSKMTELVGGFFVQFERVISDSFPEVIVEVRVENRKRQPVVGLKEQNFLITEGKKPVQNFKLLGEANNNDFADIVILIDRSLSMKGYEEQLSGAVKELAASMDGKGMVTIVSCGSVPVTEFSGKPQQLSDFSARALKNSYSASPAMDLAVRLSANSLINAEKKRGIVYITADGSENLFTQYALSDLTAYLNNNAVSFSTVLLSQRALSDEVSYITENTTGLSYYVYRPEGLGDVISDIIAIPSGLYQFKFTSSFATEYGRKYLPVEIETYLLNRSGRDETGYFAPLQ
ncbi:hypothetical protein [Treponema sp.]|uniref:hypothetical protein n=1 Tax=Treponema sp. TaxID=166 RepID=UPI003F01A854